MIRGRHNQYTSTPNWFTSVAISSQTKTPGVPIAYSGGGSMSGSSDNTTTQQDVEIPLTIYNKSLLRQQTITITDLSFDQQAISTAADNFGAVVDDQNYSSTGYIEVVSGSSMVVNIGYGFLDAYGIVFYDLSKKRLIGTTLVVGNQTIAVPESARYFRTCAVTTDSSFKVTYLAPSSYSTELLTKLYNGAVEDYTVIQEPIQERVNIYQQQLKNLSLVVDDPLKIEIDSKGNLHLNINNLFGGGNYVTIGGEEQSVIGIKTFEKGIGIGDHLIIPDEETNSLKIVHKDKSKLGNLYTTGWLSAMGAHEGSTSGGGGATALHQLIDVMENDNLNGVLGAKEGSVLKYNGSKWYGADDQGLDLQKLQEYLNSNKYLTQPKADEMFLTPAEGDALFLTQNEGDARYLLKTVFSKIFTAYDINNKVVDITSENTVIDSIKVNYNFWSSGYVSALGKQENSGSVSGPMTLSDLSDVSSDGGKVSGAKNGSVLMYDGTQWYGGEIETSQGIDKDEVLDILAESNYATQSWVNQQNYATSTQITNLEDKISNLIQSVSSATEALNGEPGVLYVLH